jgi:hypothetical protein
MRVFLTQIHGKDPTGYVRLMKKLLLAGAVVLLLAMGAATGSNARG